MLILHGENLVASRLKLIEEIEKFKFLTKGEVLNFESNQLDITRVRQVCESNSLFGNQNLIVIEDFFSSSSLEKQKIGQYFKKEIPKNVILWEKKKIDGRTLSAFKTQVLQFDLTIYIFRFLDSLAPGNAKLCLNFLHQSLAQDSPEMVFYMLIRQIRLLIIAADLGEKGLKNLPPWRKNKYIYQSKRFGLSKLLSVYRQLLKIDWQQKTGQAAFDLGADLDLLIASL